MIALLDTHSFLWAVAAPEKLSAKMRGVVADQRSANGPYDICAFS